MDPIRSARQALAEVSPVPGEEIEIFCQSLRERSYEITRGRLENSESRNAFGAAVRVLSDGRLGFAYRADMRTEAVAAAVTEARDLARRSSPDAARALPGVRVPARVSTPAPVDLQAVPKEEKINLARRLEVAALASDPRVHAAHQATYQEEETLQALVNSHGVELSWSFQEFSLGVAAVAAAGGDSQLGEEYRVWRAWSRLDPETVGRLAGERAARLLQAAPLPTGKRRLVVPPSIGAGFLEAAIAAWSAEAVQRGRSFLAGREGQQIAAGAITLIDDGTAPGGLATAPVDDEGTPMQRTELINQGRLAGFLHNHETARRGGVQSTGNAYRAGIQAPPAVGPTNIILLPDSVVPEQLLAQAEGGLYLAEVLGLHTLDPVTGEFSLGASGWLIEHGAPVRPVRGVTIAGRLEDFLKQVEAVGSDLTTYGRVSVPTLLVKDIMVAGI